ncbi:MAG: hypothetical protein ACYTXI_33960 [Nostoc sp.]
MLDICALAVPLNEWVLTPSTPIYLQASRKILSTMNRIRRSVTPRIPGNIVPGRVWVGIRPALRLALVGCPQSGFYAYLWW